MRILPEDIPIQQRTPGCLVPLTALQRQFWKIADDGRMSPRTGELSLRILGPLDTSALRQSLEAVIQRHESLRTRISIREGNPIQQIDEEPRFDLEEIDLTGMASADRTPEVDRLAQEFMNEKIDLLNGPLLTTRLLKLSEHDHILLFGIDHIISDGASGGIITKELWTLYHHTTLGLSCPLPAIPVQFADYVVWQDHTYESCREGLEAYWKDRLSSARPMELPFDRQPTDATDFNWIAKDFPVGKTLSTKLRHLAWRERTPLPLLLLVVIIAVVSRWCGSMDLTIRFASHGRQGRPELAFTSGCLVHFLNLRIQMSESDSFIDLLKRLAMELRSAHRHPDFDRMPDIIPGYTPAIFFNWAQTSWTQRSLRLTYGDIEVRRYPINRLSGTANEAFSNLVCSLLPEGNDATDGIVMLSVYQPDLFFSRTIEMLEHNVRLFAEQFVESPHTRVSSMNLAR